MKQKIIAAKIERRKDKCKSNRERMEDKGAMLPIILSIHLKNIKSSIVLYFLIYPPLGGAGGGQIMRAALPLSSRAAAGWPAAGWARSADGAPRSAGAARSGAPQECGRRERAERTPATAPWGWPQCPSALGVAAVRALPAAGGGRWAGEPSAQRYLSPP